MRVSQQDPAPAAEIARHLDDARPARLGVAVSGGGDSLALLDLAADWAGACGVPLSAVTLDHGLRPEAAEEAAAVTRFCASRDIPHDILGWDGSAHRGNLQAAAREARYRLIGEWAQARDIPMVALGHTRDDLAETFLMRLARAAGSDGLRAMPGRFERGGVTWLRPLRAVSRAALRRHLEARGLAWAEDPSNADTGFERVRARHALEALAPLGLGAGTLAGVAGHLAEENALLRRLVAGAVGPLVHEEIGTLSIRHADFAGMDPELRRRMLVAMLAWITGGNAPSGYPPRAESLRHFAEALAAGETRTLHGVIGCCRGGRVVLAREPAAVAPAMTLHDALAEGHFWDERWRVDAPEGASEAVCAAAGAEIGALGEAGLAERPEWRELGLPRQALLGLPAIREGGRLMAVPPLDADSRWRVRAVLPPFAEWLSSH